MGKVVELKTADELMERKKVVARMLLLSFLIDRWTGTNFFDQEAHDEEERIGFEMVDEEGINGIVEKCGDDLLVIEDQMLTVKEELRKWMIAMDDHA